MSTRRALWQAIGVLGWAVVLGGGFAAASASAQFLQLPKEDFVLTWGRRIPEESRRSFEDLDVQGSESGFMCNLTAKLSPSSNLTTTDIRQMENDLRTNLFFVQAVANTMYYLEQSFDLDWAILDCDKYEDDPDAATQQEREDKARARAERARERRRAREE